MKHKPERTRVEKKKKKVEDQEIKRKQQRNKQQAFQRNYGVLCHHLEMSEILVYF